MRKEAGYGCFFAAILIYLSVSAGCQREHKEWQLEIEQIKAPSVGILYDQITQICGNTPLKKCDAYVITRNRLDLDDNNASDILKHRYGLLFYIQYSHLPDKGGFKRTPHMDSHCRFVLQPCESKENHVDAFQYPDASRGCGFPGGEFSRYQPKYSVLYPVDKLRTIGYITDEEKDQKDLCLFYKLEMSGGPVTPVWRIYSNKIRYPAEEINRLMDEYRQLKGGS